MTVRGAEIQTEESFVPGKKCSTVLCKKKEKDFYPFSPITQTLMNGKGFTKYIFIFEPALKL
jgi:hypothetical protein